MIFIGVLGSLLWSALITNMLVVLLNCFGPSAFNILKNKRSIEIKRDVRFIHGLQIINKENEKKSEVTENEDVKPAAVSKQLPKEPVPEILQTEQPLGGAYDTNTDAFNT